MASTKQNSVVFHFEKAHGPINILHVLRVLQYDDEGVTDGQTWEQLAREQSAIDTRYGEARALAQQLKLVEVTKEGITAMIDSEQSFSSESEDWLPQIIFTPNKPTGF